MSPFTQAMLWTYWHSKKERKKRWVGFVKKGKRKTEKEKRKENINKGKQRKRKALGNPKNTIFSIGSTIVDKVEAPQGFHPWMQKKQHKKLLLLVQSENKKRGNRCWNSRNAPLTVLHNINTRKRPENSTWMTGKSQITSNIFCSVSCFHCDFSRTDYQALSDGRASEDIVEAQNIDEQMESSVSGSILDSSLSNSGLLLPEGCVLAEQIVRNQEDFCAVWGCLQKFVKRDESFDFWSLS
jgi:hypothetical protein